MTYTIYDDVFEAVRQYEPNNPFLKAKNPFGGRLIRHNNTFEVMRLENGKLCAITQSPIFFTYYRGEPNLYDNCIPSLYRGNPSEDEIIINQLKALDFRDICRTFPTVQFAENDNQDVRYDAIAQHYGLKTNIIDITNDIGVAAYFATQQYDEYTDSYHPVTEGLGCIRKTIQMMGMSGFQGVVIGVQPFYRTARQSAYGYVCTRGEDFAKCSHATVFKQNSHMNKIICDIFSQKEEYNLFPVELITNAAKKVLQTPKITSSSIVEYCRQYQKEFGEINQTLKNYGIEITETPAFKLTRQQRRMLEKQILKGHPYGDIGFTSRLMTYSPKDNKNHTKNIID